MQTAKVGIREFRAGLAEFIAADKPVAVTRHGQTVGIFIPTPAPSHADVLALQQATDRLNALIPLDDSAIESVVADFKAERRSSKLVPRKKPR